MIRKKVFKLIIISIIILGIFLLLLLNGCSLFRQYGSIEGYVYVPDTGNKGAIIIRDSNQVPTGYKPLPGAKVSVQDFYNFVFTDINGYFLLENVMTGLVSLIIDPPTNSGYNALTTQVMVEPNTTVPIGTYGAVSLPSEGAGYWDIVINQIDDSAYPEVKVYVSVLDPGNNIPMVGATSDNFELEIIKNSNEIKINNISVAQDPETTKYPASISLVIDRSGSMEGENYDDKPLEDAKTAAKTFVNLMSSSDRAEVISFANYVTVDQSFTSDKQALYNAIDSLQSDGATALYDAIWQGLDDTDLEVNSRKAVIALTDGGENCSSNNHGGGDYNFSYSYWLEYPDNSKLIYYAVQEVKIPIYTIGLDGFNFTREKVVRDYSTTEADLKEIADKTGGVYKYAATSEYLEYIYEEIKQRIEQQYIITFTDNTGITEGYLTIKLYYNQMYGEDTKEYNPPAQEQEGKVEVPLSPYDDYSLSNKNWWLYQFEGYVSGYYGDDYHKFNDNTNCGPSCTAMVINYFKGLDITTTYQGEDFEGYPEVNCEARWNYCEENLEGGFYCTDWYVPGQMGATEDQIINVLSSEGIETQKFTGYDFLQSEGGGMIKKIKESIDQDLLCICEVDICEYAITCDEGKDHTHWVVVYGYDNDNIYLNDSGYQKDGKGRKVPNEIFANALWQFNGISVFVTCGY